MATWTNRVQNKAEMVIYDTKGNANNIYYEEETEGWLRIQPPLYHDQYVIIAKLQDSGTRAGRFLHATRFEYKNGVLGGETDLTPGTREVVSLLLVDHARSRLYYLGTELDKPSHKNLYSVQLAGNEPPICLSCHLLTPEGKHNVQQEFFLLRLNRVVRFVHNYRAQVFSSYEKLSLETVTRHFLLTKINRKIHKLQAYHVKQSLFLR